MLKSKNTQKILAIVSLLVAATSFAAPRGTQVSPLEMMASAVRVEVTVEYTRFAEEEDQSTSTKGQESWSGSGVVYAKVGQGESARSRILSAFHVLNTPAVGSLKEDNVEFLGLVLSKGTKRTDAVSYKIQTADGRTCNLKVLALGSADEHDTAVGEADCDAGRVAALGDSVPVMGEKLSVVGYALYAKKPMLTEGYMSGLMDGYLLTSAPAYGGNSGGPVFHNGKVIGLLVRGNRDYTNLTFVVGIEDCLRRIGEAPPL